MFSVFVLDGSQGTFFFKSQISNYTHFVGLSVCLLAFMKQSWTEHCRVFGFFFFVGVLSLRFRRYSRHFLKIANQRLYPFFGLSVCLLPSQEAGFDRVRIAMFWLSLKIKKMFLVFVFETGATKGAGKGTICYS